MKRNESAEREQELIEIINENGQDGRLDIEDLNLAWSYWDDNETNCTDDNVAYTVNILSLSLETDCNGATMVMVEFDNETKCWGNVDFEDDMGNNLGEYIYDEVTAEY